MNYQLLQDEIIREFETVISNLSSKIPQGPLILQKYFNRFQREKSGFIFLHLLRMMWKESSWSSCEHANQLPEQTGNKSTVTERK